VFLTVEKSLTAETISSLSRYGAVSEIRKRIFFIVKRRLMPPDPSNSGSLLPEALSFPKEHLRRFGLLELDLFSPGSETRHHLIG
jgi:hypothetical protein